MPALSIENLSLRRGRDWILKDISLSVPAQSVVGLSGPNGGGKSTLFEVIAGLRKPTAGILRRRDKASIALLAQNPIVPRSLPVSVEDYVSMATWFKSESEPALTQQEAIDRLGLKDIRDRLVRELSGGEWKRVCLARCLVQGADLYLLDEPFNHLDMQGEEFLGHLMQDLALKKKKTFFVISHDWHAMNHFFGRVILLNQRILADGSVKDIANRFLRWDHPEGHEWMHLK